MLSVAFVASVIRTFTTMKKPGVMPGYAKSDGKRKSADGFFHRSQQLNRLIESETQPRLDKLRSCVTVAAGRTMFSLFYGSSLAPSRLLLLFTQRLMNVAVFGAHSIGNFLLCRLRVIGSIFPNFGGDCFATRFLTS